jgi:hypothetical protein
MLVIDLTAKARREICRQSDCRLGLGKPFRASCLDADLTKGE